MGLRSTCVPSFVAHLLIVWEKMADKQTNTQTDRRSFQILYQDTENQGKVLPRLQFKIHNLCTKETYWNVEKRQGTQKGYKEQEGEG